MKPISHTCFGTSEVLTGEFEVFRVQVPLVPVVKPYQQPPVLDLADGALDNRSRPSVPINGLRPSIVCIFVK
jgi:hypothetical protein